MKLVGFYAIVDRADQALVDALLAAAPCALQLRLKRADALDIVAFARSIRPRCARVGVPFVINDRVDIALAVGADAVHLGQTDLPLAEARAIAGRRLAIGVSTHDLAQVEAAVAGGADYLGYGPIFATRTKENPDPIQGLEALRRAVDVAHPVSIAAIGGITPSIVQQVYAAGASAACAIAAVNDAPDATAAARLMAKWPAPESSLVR